MNLTRIKQILDTLPGPDEMANCTLRFAILKLKGNSKPEILLRFPATEEGYQALSARYSELLGHETGLHPSVECDGNDYRCFLPLVIMPTSRKLVPAPSPFPTEYGSWVMFAIAGALAYEAAGIENHTKLNVVGLGGIAETTNLEHIEPKGRC